MPDLNPLRVEIVECFVLKARANLSNFNKRAHDRFLCCANYSHGGSNGATLNQTIDNLRARRIFKSVHDVNYTKQL
jgi:hypothetical protein